MALARPYGRSTLVEQDRLVESLRRLKPPARGPAPKVEVGPGSAFEAVLEERLKSMEKQMAEVRGRVNGLIFLVVGAVIVEIVLRAVR